MDLRRLVLISILAAASVPARAAEPVLHRFSRTEIHMAVDFEVVVYAESEARANEALTKAMARIAALDKALSDYDPESELSKLSDSSRVAAGQEAFPRVPLSDDLWNVLSLAERVSRESRGAFDVTIGPLSRLWRRARRWKELPEAEQLAAARASVDYQWLRLDAQTRTAQLLRANMRLDLGGIAKGYAADEALRVVRACGLPRALVRASGDIAAGEPPPDERGWRVGLAPLNPDEPPVRFIALAGAAVSTSGDARQHLVVDGRRYSHIIDPRTGLGVAGRSSVTVIAPQGALADSLATAISVLGPQEGLALVQRFPGAELYLVYEDDAGRQTTVQSPGFARYVTGGP